MDMDQVEMLKTAYKAHKNELMYRRRAEYYTVMSSVLMYTMAIILPFVYSGFNNSLIKTGEKTVLTLLVILIADIQCYFLMKNYRRQSEIQRAIRSIDFAFGFFEPGAYLEDAALYEESWKKSGSEKPFGVFSRLMIIFSMAGLLIITLWPRNWG